MKRTQESNELWQKIQLKALSNLNTSGSLIGYLEKLNPKLVISIDFEVKKIIIQKVLIDMKLSVHN